MTTSSPKAPIKPDDVCEVCGTEREWHGDKNHKFSEEGELVPVLPAPKRREDPPAVRGETTPKRTVGAEHVSALHLRLVEVLVAKKLLDAEDLLKIFGAHE